jgi:hypothetical protein
MPMTTFAVGQGLGSVARLGMASYYRSASRHDAPAGDDVIRCYTAAVIAAVN